MGKIIIESESRTTDELGEEISLFIYGVENMGEVDSVECHGLDDFKIKKEIDNV